MTVLDGSAPAKRNNVNMYYDGYDNQYVYTYLCVYMYMYIYIYIYKYVYIYIYTHMYTHADQVFAWGDDGLGQSDKGDNHN